MSYVAKMRKSYNKPAAEIGRIVSTAVERLGGKESKKSNPVGGYLDANFNKKIGGKPINNRVQLEAKIKADSPEQSTMAVMAYPVDPLGNKLGFGVQGEPAQTVLDAFFNLLGE